MNPPESSSLESGSAPAQNGRSGGVGSGDGKIIELLLSIVVIFFTSIAEHPFCLQSVTDLLKHNVKLEMQQKEVK